MTWFCQYCLEDGDSSFSLAHRFLGVTFVSCFTLAYVLVDKHRAPLVPLSFPNMRVTNQAWDIPEGGEGAQCRDLPAYHPISPTGALAASRPGHLCRYATGA